jgi:hypothetical protein
MIPYLLIGMEFRVSQRILQGEITSQFWHLLGHTFRQHCWVEMRQGTVALPVSAERDDGMLYLCDQAKWISDCSNVSQDELEIDLDDVDDDAARW